MNDGRLVFLHSGHYVHCNARVDKHFDGYFTLQLITAGGVSVIYDDRECVLSPGWFWPAYPGPRVRMRPAEGHKEWEHRYVAFSGSLTSRWLAEGLFPTQPQVCPHGVDYARVFDDLLAHVDSPSAWAPRRAVNLLEQILLDLADARVGSNRRLPWLESVIDQLSSATGFTPDYEIIASQLGMSFRTLRAKFKEVTGVPIHTYVMQLRIAKARRFLGETQRPIKAIAEELGYEDVYFFTKQFKKLVGTTPAVYRRTRLGG